MSQEYIKNKALALVRQWETRNPEQIASHLGLNIKYADIGSLKGFYTTMLGSRFIVINQELEERQKQLVIAHELGHEQLHDHLTEAGELRETMLCDLSSKPEFEANLFAAHLLLDVCEVEQLAKDGATVAQIAAASNVDENLVALLLGQHYRSDFLKG